MLHRTKAQLVRALGVASTALASRVLAPTALAIALLAPSAPAFAQGSFPNRAITIIVGSPAGGGGDTVARASAEQLSQIVGQPVIVENRPGANGNIGARAVANAQPDGYTLLFAFPGHVINPSLMKSIPFDTVNDFAPIIMLATNETVLVVKADSPIRSVADLIAAFRREPGKLNMGALPGSTQHLAGELFKSMSKTDFVIVPYKGNAGPVQDLLGGRLQFMFNTYTATASLLASNQLRAIAVTSTKRSQLLPAIPTVAESGLPGFSTVGWYGLLAPAKTPPDIIQKLYSATREGIERPEVRQSFAKLGNVVVAMPPGEFDAFIRAEIPRWQKVLEGAGVKPE